MKLLSTTIAVALALPALAVDPPTTVTLSAGKFDRANAVVTFKLPAGVDAKTPWLLNDGKTPLRLQVLPGGVAALILPSLKAGETAQYRLELAPQVTRPPLPTDVSYKQEGNNVALSVGQKQAFTYQGDKLPLPQGYDPAFHRGGYLYPVLTPAGKLVVDDYPPNHKHHHGIWFPWTKTEFEGRKPDFWNMGQKSGTVEFVELSGAPYGGEVAGGFSTKHRFVDLSAKPAPKAALNETWDVVIYGVPAGDKPVFLFDLVSTQTCASESPLVLPKYHYGGIGVRGNRAWDGKPNAVFLTSEGKTRANGNESTGRWVHMGGKVDGADAGIALLCHPENFRAPQPLRIHPTEPFVCYAPQQGGDMKIEPGKPYVSRYRVVVADGQVDKALLERLYADYADPVGVTVK